MRTGRSAGARVSRPAWWVGVRMVGSPEAA